MKANQAEEESAVASASKQHLADINKPLQNQIETHIQDVYWLQEIITLLKQQSAKDSVQLGSIQAPVRAPGALIAQTNAESPTKLLQMQMDNSSQQISHLQATIVSLEEQKSRDSQALSEALRTLDDRELQLRRAKANKTQGNYRRDAMRKKIERFPARLAKARSNIAIGTEIAPFSLKDHTGAVLPQIRTVVRQLACQGVASERMLSVIFAVAQGLGVNIVGSISARTVSRVIGEGLVQARMQLGAELSQVPCK